MPSYKTSAPVANQLYVDEGDYKLKVVEAKDDTSKAGNDMVKLKLRVIKSDGTEGPCLFDYLVFSEKCFWKIDNFLQSCGRHPGEGKDLDVKSADLVGLELEATLKVEEFEGTKSNKVEAYLWDEGF